MQINVMQKCQMQCKLKAIKVTNPPNNDKMYITLKNQRKLTVKITSSNFYNIFMASHSHYCYITKTWIYLRSIVHNFVPKMIEL